MNPEPDCARPLAPVERIVSLDVLRGIALLGVFVVNMPYFGMSLFAGARASRNWPDFPDRLAERLTDVLIAGKFHGIFSFLFAVGFTLQIERLYRSKPTEARSIFLRRLLFLFVVGILHAICLWIGDILHIYALMGLVLLALRKVSDRALIALIMASMLAPLALDAWQATLPNGHAWRYDSVPAETWVATNDRALGAGSWLDAAAEQARELRFFYTNTAQLQVSVHFWMQLLTTALLGLLAGRHRWLTRAPEHPRLLIQCMFAGGMLGLATGLGYSFVNTRLATTYPSAFDALREALFEVSRLGLMTFIIAGVLLALMKPALNGILGNVGVAGRMPLTNYLSQSVLGTLIFYGWGFGLWGRAGPLANIGLAIGLFVLVQIPFSLWWLRRYRYGPMEGLWRRFTYGARA